jgi:hypothetical protein
MKRLTNEKIVEALRQGKGFQTKAAEILGCSRFTIARRLDKSPEVRAAYEEIAESRLDVAESRLAEAVEQGAPWAIRYVLDNLGAKRGYGNKDPWTLFGGI